MSLPYFNFLQNLSPFSQEEEWAQDLQNYLAVCTATVPANSYLHLVQYSKSPNNIIFSILHEDYIYWPKDVESAKHKKVLINDGSDMLQDAIAFYAHNSTAHIEDELEKMRCKLFYLIHNATQTATEEQSNYSWLLVQYRNNSKNLVYAIVNNAETIPMNTTQFKDLLTNIKDGDQVLKAVILRKSLQHSLIKAELDKIKKEVPTWQFPLQDSNGLTTTYDESFKEEIEFQLQLKTILNEMESRMESEALSINETFDAINNMRNQLQLRIYNANHQRIEYDTSSSSNY